MYEVWWIFLDIEIQDWENLSIIESFPSTDLALFWISYSGPLLLWFFFKACLDLALTFGYKCDTGCISRSKIILDLLKMSCIFNVYHEYK